jgi:hypothetical protein
MEEEGPHQAEDGVADTVNRVRSNNVRNVRSNNVRSISVQALLDSGCLAGDCMSHKIVDNLKAAHLLVYIDTTICSGFDNTGSNRFPSLLINVSFLNEITFLRESFQTRVLILPNSPMDFLISRDTIKQQQFILKTPSHFIDQTKLIESSLTTEPFGDKAGGIKSPKSPSQELYSTDLSQTEFEGQMPLRSSILINTKSERNFDDSVVDEGPLVKTHKQTRRREDRVNTPPSVCPYDRTLPRGSCRDGGSSPRSLQ